MDEVLTTYREEGGQRCIYYLLLVEVFKVSEWVPVQLRSTALPHRCFARAIFHLYTRVCTYLLLYRKPNTLDGPVTHLWQ